MIRPGRTSLESSLFSFFALFVFGSTFSIALSQIALGLSLALFLLIVIVERHNPFASSLKWFYLSIALYVFWLVLTAVLGPTPLRSVLIIKEEWLFCVIPIALFLLRHPSHGSRLVLVFGTGVLLVSLYGIFQHFTGVNFLKSYPLKEAPDFGYLAYGGFSHPLTFGNYYGTAAAFLLAYALGNRRQLDRLVLWLLIAAALLGMVAAMLSYSRAVLFGVALALVILGASLGRRYLVLLLIVVAAMSAIVFLGMPGLAARFTAKVKADVGGVYEGGRIFIWKNSWKIVQEHPWFGVGQGNFRDAYAGHLRSDIPEKRKLTHAHNDLLNIAAISGLPGAIIFAAMWVSVLCHIWRARRVRAGPAISHRIGRAALLGCLVFLVTALFEATFADEEVRQMLMFLWALGLWPLVADRRAGSAEPRP